MTDHAESGADGPTGVSRRRVLAGSAAVLGGASGLVAPAAGQSRQITFPAVIPRPERWADENLAGFMIHVGGETDPAERGAARNCDFADWPPEEFHVYEATLINRKQVDTPEEDVLLYTAEDAPVPAGVLFLVNKFDRCESGYVGVRVKRIGQFDVGEAGRPRRATDYGPVADVDQAEPATVPGADGGGDGLDVVDTGIGAAATLVGLLGVGALARWIGWESADE